MLTNWLPELFAKNTHDLGIFGDFQAGCGPNISSNLLTQAFATWQHAFLSTSIMSYDLTCLGMCKNKKILDEKVTHVFRLFVFFPFLFLLFLSFAVIDWACFPFKNFRESIIEMVNFCQGVATWGERKFCSKFFTQICEQLHWANHTDTGIIGKNFSSCRSWV